MEKTERTSKQRETTSLDQMSSAQIYWKLFVITLTLSASTFGGGFVIISMMKLRLVERLKWLAEDEMLDLTAISQSSPGALGVNIAVAVGYRIKKTGGAIVCTLGAIIPPLIIISIISVFYNQFKDNTYIAIALQVMRAGVAAVIFDVVIDLAKNVIKTKSVLWIVMMIAAFIAVCFFKVGAIVIILICGSIGFLYAQFDGRKEKAK